MPQEFDVLAPCLCCNTAVWVRSRDWGPYVAALCSGCYESTPFFVLRVLFTLRCQIASLSNQIRNTEGRMDLLFNAQQELEKELAG